MSMVTFVPEPYVPPQEFQLPSIIYVETKDGKRMTLDAAKQGNIPVKKLILKPRDGMLYNMTYSICAEPGIKSVTGKTLRKEPLFLLQAPMVHYMQHH